MNKQQEALKLALEALEKVTKEMLDLKDELAERGARPTTNVFHQRLWDSAFKAYTDHALPAAVAIREALAEQPAQQQEPVAWVCYGWSSDEKHAIDYEQHEIDAIPVGTLLYTSPPASKPKQQEPVANELKLHIIRKWPEGFQDRLQHVWLDVVSFIPDVKLYDLQRVLAEFGFTMKVYEGEPPASKPWVGLTDDAILDMAEGCTAQYHDLLALARAIEAKLREKNA